MHVEDEAGVEVTVVATVVVAVAAETDTAVVVTTASHPTGKTEVEIETVRPRNVFEIRRRRATRRVRSRDTERRREG